MIFVGAATASGCLTAPDELASHLGLCQGGWPALKQYVLVYYAKTLPQYILAPLQDSRRAGIPCTKMTSPYGH